MSDVHVKVSQVSTREDLSAFVRALRLGLVEGTVKFENRDLDSYLEALSAWVDDMDGCYETVPEQPSWRTVAEILMAAAIYE